MHNLKNSVFLHYEDVLTKSLLYFIDNVMFSI